jgi:hypothetical protein
MKHFKTGLSSAAFLLLGIAGLAQAQESRSKLRLFDWERGIGFESPHQKDMRMYLWFYEWNLFEARRPGPHTIGTYRLPRKVSDDGAMGEVRTKDLHLTVKSGTDAADLTLAVTNLSDHDWPELAAIIPCFNPGPKETRNPLFANTNTYFYGPRGLERLQKREIHFAQTLRPALDRISPEGQFVFSFKWPTSPVNAAGGILIRESTDGKWVTGIAWEDFLSAQGHNPWECMHLSVRVGPLKRQKQKIIRGKLYLLQGTKEDCFKRFLSDFEQRK